MLTLSTLDYHTVQLWYPALILHCLQLDPNLCNLQSTVLRSHPKLNHGRVITYRAKLIDMLTSDDFHKLASFGAEDVLRP